MYEPIRALGSGSFGEVKLCEDQANGRVVAVKTVKLGNLSATKRRKSLGEALLLQKLHKDHEGILQCLDVIVQNDCVQLILEHALFGDLLRQLDHFGSLSQARTLGVVYQISSALRYCHKKRVLHRDLKPSNVLLFPEGKCKLADFGVASHRENEEQGSLLANTIIGTPQYFAPEVMNAEPYGVGCDIWALGICIYEMMAWPQRPFPGTNLPRLAMQVALEEAQELNEAVKFINPFLSQQVSKFLRKRPMERMSLEDVEHWELFHPAEYSEWKMPPNPPEEHVDSEDDSWHVAHSFKSFSTFGFSQVPSNNKSRPTSARPKGTPRKPDRHDSQITGCLGSYPEQQNVSNQTIWHTIESIPLDSNIPKQPDPTSYFKRQPATPTKGKGDPLFSHVGSSSSNKNKNNHTHVPQLQDPLPSARSYDSMFPPTEMPQWSQYEESYHPSPAGEPNGPNSWADPYESHDVFQLTNFAQCDNDDLATRTQHFQESPFQFKNHQLAIIPSPQLSDNASEISFPPSESEDSNLHEDVKGDNDDLMIMSVTFLPMKTMHFSITASGIPLECNIPGLQEHNMIENQEASPIFLESYNSLTVPKDGDLKSSPHANSTEKLSQAITADTWQQESQHGSNPMYGSPSNSKYQRGSYSSERSQETYPSDWDDYYSEIGSPQHNEMERSPLSQSPVNDQHVPNKKIHDQQLEDISCMSTTATNNSGSVLEVSNQCIVQAWGHDEGNISILPENDQIISCNGAPSIQESTIPGSALSFSDEYQEMLLYHANELLNKEWVEGQIQSNEATKMDTFLTQPEECDQE